MSGEQVVNWSSAQAQREQIKRRTCHAQGCPFELRTRCLRVLADAQHHGKDPDPRHDLDERIHAETEEGQRLIADAKEDGDQSLAEVIKNCEQRQP